MKRIAICLAAFAMLVASSSTSRAQCRSCVRTPFVSAATTHACGKPVCTCQTQTLRPVAETRLRPRQVVTHRDVPTVQYRQQAITQQVPVTQYQNITVDEGQYKAVWVSKLVTKQVARTSYVPRTTYRNVPQIVNRRVAQIQTQLVPERTVRYVPQTNQITFQPSQPLFEQAQPQLVPMTPITANIGQCVSGQPNATGLQMSVPSTAHIAPIYPTLPVTAYRAPLPTARFTHAAPIEPTLAPLGATASRTNDDLFRRDYVPAASNVDLPGDNPATLGQPEPISDYETSSTQSPAAGRFIRAPSAARVWRSSFR